MVTPEQFRARLDAAIERSRAALDELIALRDALAGAPVGELTADEIREIDARALAHAERMRRARRAP